MLILYKCSLIKVNSSLTQGRSCLSLHSFLLKYVSCNPGANTTIKNNAKKMPYDLAKDPECGRLLRGAIGNSLHYFNVLM